MEPILKLEHIQKYYGNGGSGLHGDRRYRTDFFFFRVLRRKSTLKIFLDLLS